MSPVIENLRYTISEKRIENFSFPTGNEVGEVAPGCWLIEENNNYAIIAVNGKIGHEILWFEDKPTPDPDCVSESFEWLDKIMEWAEETTMSAEDGYFLCSAAKKNGWKEGNVLLWFYQKSGQILERKN